MGEWKYSSTILDLGTRCKWVVSFTLLPLYSRGNRPRHPLDRKLGGPQSRSGRCEEDKNLPPAGNTTRSVQPVARHYTDWAIPNPLAPRKKNFILYASPSPLCWTFAYTFSVIFRVLCENGFVPTIIAVSNLQPEVPMNTLKCETC
jgi:hypothetical protein